MLPLHMYYIIRTSMDNNFKIKIDALIQEISEIKDLKIKADILDYVERQAGFLLWQMEDELHIDEDVHNY